MDFHYIKAGSGLLGLTKMAQPWFTEGSCWYSVYLGGEDIFKKDLSEQDFSCDNTVPCINKY